MQVRFTESARVRFLEGLAFIRRDRPEAARGLKARTAEALRRLSEFPDSGRIIPEYPDLPHREVVVRPFRFFYRVVGDVVWIVAVWHMAQDAAEPAD